MSIYCLIWYGPPLPDNALRFGLADAEDDDEADDGDKESEADDVAGKHGESEKQRFFLKRAWCNSQQIKSS
jgi:hypothetical protein